MLVHTHPALKDFPHEGFGDWQFFPMMRRSNSLIYDQSMPEFAPVFELIPSFKMVKHKSMLSEFAVGKGKWIFSAVQPFGNSDIVLEPGAWQDFMRDQAKVIGEKCDLPIWRFTLPAPAKLNIPKPLK